MRYEVGTKYPFMHVDYTPATPRYRGLYLPWEDRLNNIAVAFLECVEHHKVPDCHDPDRELKYDGYVFVDIHGKRWANQYPSASYGQIDDTMNWLVLPMWEDAETHERFTDARIYLARVQRGVRDLAKEPTEEELASGPDRETLLRYSGLLEAHLQECFRKIESVGSVKVEIVDRIVNYTDGKPARVIPNDKIEFVPV